MEFQKCLSISNPWFYQLLFSSGKNQTSGFLKRLSWRFWHFSVYFSNSVFCWGISTLKVCFFNSLESPLKFNSSQGFFLCLWYIGTWSLMEVFQFLTYKIQSICIVKKKTFSRTLTKKALLLSSLQNFKTLLVFYWNG